jgi:hypothetical protein
LVASRWSVTKSLVDFVELDLEERPKRLDRRGIVAAGVVFDLLGKLDGARGAEVAQRAFESVGSAAESRQVGRLERGGDFGAELWAFFAEDIDQLAEQLTVAVEGVKGLLPVDQRKLLGIRIHREFLQRQRATRRADCVGWLVGREPNQGYLPAPIALY